MTGLPSLISSAFGPRACLYADVLQCDRTATPAELRRAYYRRAQLYHPDKQQKRAAAAARTCVQGGDDENCDGPEEVREAEERRRLRETTLRFQAASAAYELLADPGRRALYDATGRLDESFGGRNCGPGGNSSSSGGPRRAASRATTDDGGDDDDQQRRWSEFFQSVFSEVITTAARAEHESASYRGSDREAADVLKFYTMCRGDLDKVLRCVVSGTAADRARWMDDIIEPAIRRGDVERYDDRAVNQTTGGGREASSILVNTDDEDDAGETRKRKRRIMRKGVKSVPTSKAREDGDSLVDTDDDNDDENHVNDRDKAKAKAKTIINKPSSSSTNKASMSKKDKMEYRVAKKQKAKKEREIELAKTIKDKQWGSRGGGAARVGMVVRRGARPGAAYAFSDDLISSLENKYSAAGNNDGAPAKTRKLEGGKHGS